MEENLVCCYRNDVGGDLSIKNLEHHRFIDCFKSIKFFKKRTTDGREIKKEIVLVALCPVCKHYIIKYLWYTSKSARFFDWSETKDIRGKKADDVFIRYVDFFEFYDIPNPYKDSPQIKQSKKIPWVYGKALNENTQIPRYYNESGNAGQKIYAPIKKESI